MNTHKMSILPSILLNTIGYNLCEQKMWKKITFDIL